ncbi:MAG: hypothetical protein ACLP9Y_32115 [Mycobacterium sp.]
MTNPTPSDASADSAEAGNSTGPPEPTRRGPGAWGIAAIVCGAVAVALLIAALILVHWDVGSKAEWCAGTGAFAAVIVALWQTISIQRQAKDDAKEAQKRLRHELAAAEQRSARELENARELHRVELEHQREVARVQRVHLCEQESNSP